MCAAQRRLADRGREVRSAAGRAGELQRPARARLPASGLVWRSGPQAAAGGRRCGYTWTLVRNTLPALLAAGGSSTRLASKRALTCCLSTGLVISCPAVCHKMGCLQSALTCLSHAVCPQDQTSADFVRRNRNNAGHKQQNKTRTVAPAGSFAVARGAAQSEAPQLPSPGQPARLWWAWNVSTHCRNTKIVSPGLCPVAAQCFQACLLLAFVWLMSRCLRTRACRAGSTMTVLPALSVIAVLLAVCGSGGRPSWLRSAL